MEMWRSGFPKTTLGWPAGWGQKLSYQPVYANAWPHAKPIGSAASRDQQVPASRASHWPQNGKGAVVSCSDQHPTQEAGWELGLGGADRFGLLFRNLVWGRVVLRPLYAWLGIVCSGVFLYFYCPLVRSGKGLATWCAEFMHCIKAVLMLAS